MSLITNIRKIPVIGYILRKSKNVLLPLLPVSVLLKFYDRTDWTAADKEVADYYNTSESGITADNEKRSPKIIVSLTSYPARIQRIHYTLVSLLKQTVKPDEIVLWLGIEKFPNREKDLPETLLKLQGYGLTIKWCKDIRCFTKLIPSLKEYPNDFIVTADDDIFYHQEWLERLYAYKKDNTCVHCHRAHLIKLNRSGKMSEYKNWQFGIPADRTKTGFFNFLTGVGGVLYPPCSLHKDVTNEELFMKLCPTNDDIWFWAMAVMQGTKISVIGNNLAEPMLNHPLSYEEILGKSGLAETNVLGGQNDIQLRNVLEAYPLLKERLEIS